MNGMVQKRWARRYGFLLVALLFLTCLIACDGGAAGEAGQEQDQEQSNGQAAVNQDEMTTDDPPGEEVAEEAVEETPPVIEEPGQVTLHLTHANTLEGETVSLPGIADYRMVELADGQQRMVLYTDLDRGLTILDPSDLVYDTLPYLLNVQPDTAADRMGNFMEMVADRWEDGRYYTVLQTSELHLYDYESGQSELAYAADRPIYNLAVSPDRNHIALLISEETIPYSVADLVVLDTSGQVIYEQERAVTLHHSDGFWMFYPLQWLDDVTVRAESFASEEERQAHHIAANDVLYRDFRIDDGSSNLIEIAQARLLEEESVLELTGEALELPISDEWRERLTPPYEGDAVLYARSPDGGFIVFTVGNQLYLYNVEQATFQSVGAGHFVQWNDAQSFIWLQGYSPYVT